MLILLAKTKMLIGHSLEDAGEPTHYFETSKFRYGKNRAFTPFPVTNCTTWKANHEGNFSILL